jgi:hypothetical protein
MPEHLRDLVGPVLVLALIPPRCQCFSDLRQLTVQADRGGAVIYLVGTGGANVDSLPRRLALGAAHALDDSENDLPPSYHTQGRLGGRHRARPARVPDREGVAQSHDRHRLTVALAVHVAHLLIPTVAVVIARRDDAVADRLSGAGARSSGVVSLL